MADKRDVQCYHLTWAVEFGKIIVNRTEKPSVNASVEGEVVHSYLKGEICKHQRADT